MAGGYWIAARLDPLWGHRKPHNATYKPFILCKHGFLVEVCRVCPKTSEDVDRSEDQPL